MQAQNCLPWLRHALGYKFFLSFLIVLFVIPTKGQPLLHELSVSSIIIKKIFHSTEFFPTTCAGPTITTQPTNQNTCVGTNASFSVAATGVGTLSYQWQENQGSGFNNISGANNASYIINSVSASQNNYSYQVIITDDNGTPGVTSDDCMTTSTIVTLTVINIICDSSPWDGNN